MHPQACSGNRRAHVSKALHEIYLGRVLRGAGSQADEAIACIEPEVCPKQPELYFV